MPLLTVIAGPNGSGKSTLTEMLIRSGVSFGDYLNADDIARDLSGSPEEVSARAQQIVRDRREQALDEGRDHAFETVMSHISHIDYMKAASANGFTVRLYFVATEDPAINLDRVSNRVIHGGHDVPRNRIIARYHRCLGNLPDAIGAANQCEIFDNSSAERPLKPLAVIRRSGRGAVLTHTDIQPESGLIDPGELPIWWYDVLRDIKPDDPFASGLLP